MPNLQKIEAHHQRIARIQESIRTADRFVDKKAFLELDGKRELYTITQLGEMIQKEEAELRKCV